VRGSLVETASSQQCKETGQCAAQHHTTSGGLRCRIAQLTGTVANDTGCVLHTEYWDGLIDHDVALVTKQRRSQPAKTDVRATVP